MYAIVIHMSGPCNTVLSVRVSPAALKTALRAAESVGSAGVITHPLDDSLRRFYTRWGFQDLPLDPRRAMMDLHESFKG